MEPNFIKASSENLPEVNYIMIQEFFAKNMDYFSVEFRSVKNVRASRAGYGDDAIGYVQIKREGSVCTVKGKIVPEQRVRNEMYSVTALFNEDNDTIISCECESCTAAQGGCKHAIAFIYWILRRNDEKSPTAVECYWKKPTLGKVGTNIKYIKAKDLKAGESSTPIVAADNFLEKVVDHAIQAQSSAQILKYFKAPSEVRQMSLHYLAGLYLEDRVGDMNAENFLSFCASHMSDELCTVAAKDTSFQSKTPLWYELRYGRITASRIYDAAHCKTEEGALIESIFGASTFVQTEAMKRGLLLEDKVLEVVGKIYNTVFKKTGLVLDKTYPALGASPDGINREYVVEIKCPTKKETIKNYLRPSGRLTAKSYGQIHLQMLFCKKEKGLFCIADPEFEKNNKVQILEIDFHEGIFIKLLIEDAMKFWKNIIFPKLMK